MRCFITILSVLALQGYALAGEKESGPKDNDDTIVGINYFAGWWKSLPNKWHGQGWNVNQPDWRTKYPDRIPLLGEYNTQTTMEREIAAAAGHGVDFFAILYYFPRPGSREEKYAPLLNRGLETFVNARNSGMMKFFIEYCNAPNFSATSEKEWKTCVKTWVASMKHPSYLRIDGRLVFKVHGVTQFLKTHNNDYALVGISGQTPPLGAKWPPASIFDFTATYMCVPKIEEREKAYPYSTLAKQARATLKNRVTDPIPWMPHLAAGWNPRPWTYPKAAPHYQRFFEFPTRKEFTHELKDIKEALSKHSSLGLPRKDGTRQKAFTIYAWNEFGEGGIVAPTKGKGYMMLECIKAVFGTNPESRKNNERQPVEQSPGSDVQKAAPQE
jgi:hypothetical protein